MSKPVFGYDIGQKDEVCCVVGHYDDSGTLHITKTLYGDEARRAIRRREAWAALERWVAQNGCMP